MKKIFRPFSSGLLYLHLPFHPSKPAAHNALRKNTEKHKIKVAAFGYFYHKI